MTQWANIHQFDPSKFHIEDTARHTGESRELIERLVQHSIAAAEATDTRERQMLRWTRAGVMLAAIAALAAITSIVVTLAVR